MSSFITRFLASMSMKDSKSTQPAEARPRRHERSSRNHHHRSSRHSQYRSSYVYDSDETEVETDDEPPANSLMLDLGPDYSPKAMSTISFPSPPTRGGTLLFETDEMDNSPQHIETRQPSAAAQAHPKPAQYYNSTSAAQAEAAAWEVLEQVIHWVPTARASGIKNISLHRRVTMGMVEVYTQNVDLGEASGCMGPGKVLNRQTTLSQTELSGGSCVRGWE
ncbi:unnamed protein product [Rhizoctonia solani]|uniref:Uncharacterized protein n=1 Tax=Rhizoctonia solani TaxID=456999 RepID=A0A8H2WEJ9_9AGAM|nr:unnamed protein product [Rhizoctonia solani]